MGVLGQRGGEEIGTEEGRGEVEADIVYGRAN
jgi:hypothetical protein